MLSGGDRQSLLRLEVPAFAWCLALGEHNPSLPQFPS